MKIHIPNSAFLGNIEAFLRRLDLSNPTELEISANEKWISAHPMVLAMIAALGAIAKPQISCSPMTARSAPYLVRMKLFDLLGVDCGIQITEHESAGRFIPVTQVRTSGELTAFITEMVPLLHLPPEKAEPIKYVVSELARNVLEHAQTQHGAFLAAQYLAKTNRISIGIADTGVGVRSSINASYNTTTDLEAIKLALMPGVTGTTRRIGGTAQNAGAGLFFTKSIAYINRTHFVIYSGHAMYKLLKRSGDVIQLHADPLQDRHSAKSDLPAWPGTAVGIDISLDHSPQFAVLLKHIRNTYHEALKERRQAQYKKPRFI